MMDERMTESERTTLCRRIDELCAENERLRQENQSIGVAAYELGRKSMADENAKLRNQLHDQQDTAEHNFVRNAREYKRVCDENAKLRELVRDAWGSGHPDRSCESCDIRDECHDDIERMRKDGVLRFSRCLFELRIEERMRELGVEVDDG